MKRLILVFASAALIAIAMSWVARHTDAPVPAPAAMQTRSQVEPPNAAWDAQLARLKEERRQMPELLTEVAFGAIGGMFVLLGWFLRAEVARNDRKHADHYKHSIDVAVHETDRDRIAIKDQMRLSADALLRHQEQDDKRFDRFEGKLDLLSKNIEDIWKVVVSK